VPTPKEECEELMNAVLPFARQMLAEHGEFFPFGATMSASREITQAAGWTGTERPPSLDVIALLTEAFQAGAASGSYVATALAYDARVAPPGKPDKQDAVAVQLDHRDAYSVLVLFPYTLSRAGGVVFDAPFALPGSHSIFTA
jgi:hypothetical protein